LYTVIVDNIALRRTRSICLDRVPCSATPTIIDSLAPNAVRNSAEETDSLIVQIKKEVAWHTGNACRYGTTVGTVCNAARVTLPSQIRKKTILIANLAKIIVRTFTAKRNIACYTNTAISRRVSN
jgi:hypothetical protein